ncbi:MAG: type II toxin-antitoxin system RelE/ParE family toxin [Synergistaceae bacterium]|nr:type II toxin-antitoxin system RelE/ParE family toxin [Synergistaceae bacterium]MBQ4431570.1 type II toxin-antitoxin system RelE/ParE family toxin [Synergistaceae bacterium]MBR0151663.1 type II toxin-antitoxin system RelE/ParE family toxin [Synergistaceae bacterium]MBR0257714.1 type II toxin-antitoxin system RelE/ParE family toxin [Synergistaceae bacterium]
MTAFRVIYSDEALEELRGIRHYISHRLNNPPAASKQADRIMLATDSLAVFPKMHRIRIKDRKGREIRFFPVDSYMILYHVDEGKNVVNILHIFSSRRDIDSMI